MRLVATSFQFTIHGTTNLIVYFSNYIVAQGEGGIGIKIVQAKINNLTGFAFFV